MPRAEFLTLAPGSDRIPVELFQILKDDAVESAALNMQYAGSRHKGKETFLLKTVGAPDNLLGGQAFLQKEVEEGHFPEHRPLAQCER